MAVTMRELLEAGVHFGHRTGRWNPRMRPYIFTERSGIHIIDLQQTMTQLNSVASMITDIVAKGGTVLFVGTKRQAQATIRAEAERVNMPYVNERWLGGTLTNWNTIRQRIDYLLQTERKMDAGEFSNYVKKERLGIQHEVEKLNRRIGGLKVMRKLPDMLFVVDTSLEDLAVTEANRLKIPIVGMVDTNADPTDIDYVVPSNDDAIRAVKLIVSVIGAAVEEGLRIREVNQEDLGQVSRDDLAGMEQYLGPSTIAKLQSSDDDEDAGDVDADDVDVHDEMVGDEADIAVLGEEAYLDALEIQANAEEASDAAAVEPEDA